MNEKEARETLRHNPVKGWDEHAALMEAKGYPKAIEIAKPMAFALRERLRNDPRPMSKGERITIEDVLDQWEKGR